MKLAKSHNLIGFQENILFLFTRLILHFKNLTSHVPSDRQQFLNYLTLLIRQVMQYDPLTSASGVDVIKEKCYQLLLKVKHSALSNTK
jgi:hypothetical protein